MKELFWASVGLLALLMLTLIALGLRWQSSNKSALGISNIFEDGLLFGLFFILFAPVYLAWMGVQSIWTRVHPSAGLPTEGDDPVWSRRINQQVVETAFLGVQQARLTHNPNLAKRYISQELYRQLRHECDHANANHESEAGKKQVQIKDIVFADERIEKALCHFNATVRGVIVNATREEAGRPSNETEEFEYQLEFARALPEVHDARWQLMSMSGL